MCTSVMETIRFYADSGDLVTAAIISLIFYSEFEDISTFNQFKKYTNRVLRSYFNML